MPIYDKPVRTLLKDYVKENHIALRQAISRNQIISWFNAKYPKIKLGTINAHLLKMSVNAPSRIHYSVNQHGDDDLLFQIDPSHFRIYEPGTDPTPIYKPPTVNGPDYDIDSSEQGETPKEQTEFAYESDLRDFLSKNLNMIEPGLRLHEEEGIPGIEFPVGGRFIDILARDKDKNYVVIELKVSRGYDRVVGQLLRYMAWIEENQADQLQKVKGVIVAREISADLRLASSKVPDIKLFEYDLSVTLKEISKRKTKDN